MKISFLAPSLGSGGAERTIVYLSSFFAKADHDVEIVNISSTIFYELDEKVKYTTLGVNSSANNIAERFINIAKRFLRTNSHIKQTNPDVVFCMLPETAKFVLSLHKKGKFVLITSERNNPELDGDNELKKKVFSHSDGIVFQTLRAKEWYPQKIQQKGKVIHNAVGNELVCMVPNITSRKKVISAVGRLTAQKDYPTLFVAFNKVLEKHPEFVLEIFGNGPDEEKLKSLAKNFGLDKNIKFMGTHKDAIIQISTSACYVMSSIYEGMPNALMEAMAVGLPCVSTDCPNGPAELIENGKNGMLVPVGDADALADAIIIMIENPTFAEECGKNAKKILDTHSVEIIANQYLDYIKSVVEQR